MGGGRPPLGTVQGTAKVPLATHTNVALGGPRSRRSVGTTLRDVNCLITPPSRPRVRSPPTPRLLALPARKSETRFTRRRTIGSTNVPVCRKVYKPPQPIHQYG
jgi:hypothetical protein